MESPWSMPSGPCVDCCDAGSGHLPLHHLAFQLKLVVYWSVTSGPTPATCLSVWYLLVYPWSQRHIDEQDRQDPWPQEAYILHGVLVFCHRAAHYHTFRGLKQHPCRACSSLGQKSGNELLGPLPGPKSRCQPSRALLWREESTSKFLQAVSTVSLPTAVGLRPPVPCWLSVGGSLSSVSLLGSFSQAPPPSQQQCHIQSSWCFAFHWLPLLPPAREHSLLLKSHCDWIRPSQLIFFLLYNTAMGMTSPHVPGFHDSHTEEDHTGVRVIESHS